MKLFTPENTLACREKAGWDTFLRSIRYRVQIGHDVAMVEHLGAVKYRADGRWNWWRWQSRYHEWKPGQGVAATVEAAKARVLEGWAEEQVKPMSAAEILEEADQPNLLAGRKLRLNR